MPSYAPAKTPRHKTVSQNVSRPKKVNLDWKVRASNALPVLMQHRALVSPHSPAHTHWSEAVGHMHRIIEGGVANNRDAYATFQMAQRASMRALSLTADAG